MKIIVIGAGAWGTALALLSPVYALKLWWRGRAEPGYRAQ